MAELAAAVWAPPGVSPPSPPGVTILVVVAPPFPEHPLLVSLPGWPAYLDALAVDEPEVAILLLPPGGHVPPGARLLVDAVVEEGDTPSLLAALDPHPHQARRWVSALSPEAALVLPSLIALLAADPSTVPPLDLVPGPLVDLLRASPPAREAALESLHDERALRHALGTQTASRPTLATVDGFPADATALLVAAGLVAALARSSRLRSWGAVRGVETPPAVEVADHLAEGRPIDLDASATTPALRASLTDEGLVVQAAGTLRSLSLATATSTHDAPFVGGTATIPHAILLDMVASGPVSLTLR